jgi:hypothetical protein
LADVFAMVRRKEDGKENFLVKKVAIGEGNLL